MRVGQNIKNILNKIKFLMYNIVRGVNKMSKSYTIVIYKEENPAGYWAECLEIKECFAQAKTVEEVKKLMKEAIIIKLKEDEETVSTKDIDIVLSYA